MGIYDAIKDGISVVKASDNIELLKSFMEIQNGYWEMQEELTKIKEENRVLKEELELKEKVIFKGNMYYINNDNNEEGPFCTRCYDENRSLVRMHDMGHGYQCPVHNNIFIDRDEQGNDNKVLW